MPQSSNKVTFSNGFRTLIRDHELVEYQKNSTFRVWYGDVKDYYEKHWHSAVEIVMPVQGECVVRYTNSTYRVKVGEVLITPTGEPHDLETLPNTKRYIFLFEIEHMLRLGDFSALKSMMMFPIFVQADSPICQPLHDLLFSVVSEYDNDRPLRDLACYMHIMSIYTLLGRYHLERVYANTNTQPEKQQAYLSVFDHVMNYIDRNYMQNITLDTIAAEAGFSKYYFTRLFKQYTNTTFLHFLSIKRVQMAERLLSSTDRSIAEIALRVGFDSIPSFNRVYRQLRNITPSQYRTQYGNPSNRTDSIPKR